MRGPFENRPFRRLFAGRVVTNVGDSLYFIAAMWLVYSLTGDPFYTGVAGFLTLAPSALQFLAGPLVDRWSIRRTLVGTQAVQALVVLVVPVAHHLGVLVAELVLVVMPLLAALNQLVYPAQAAALPRLLDDEDLVAANSAFSVAYQGIDMVANAAGGVVVALVGAVGLFALDAVTFGVAALLFATVVIPAADAGAGGDGRATGEGTDGDPPGSGATVDGPRRDGETNPGVVADGGAGRDGGTEEDTADDGTVAASSGGGSGDPEGYRQRLREGATLLRGTFLVWLLAGAVVVNFTAGVALATMPAYADTLGVPGVLAALGDAGSYGLLMAGFAAGNFLGAVGAGVVDDLPLGRILVVGPAVSGVVWFGAVAVDWLPLTAALLAVALLPTGVVNVQLAAVVQSAVPDEFVGRVSSVLGSASSASIPVGSLAGGAVAGAVGPGTTMFALAGGFLALSTYSLAVPSLRSLPPVDEVGIATG